MLTAFERTIDLIKSTENNLVEEYTQFMCQDQEFFGIKNG